MEYIQQVSLQTLDRATLPILHLKHDDNDYHQCVLFTY